MRRSLLAAMLALVTLAWPVQAQLFPLNPFPDQPQPAPAADLTIASLAGRWSGHGRLLTIEPSGRAEYRWRTYSPCSWGERKPCDGSGEDFYGGRTVIVFTAIDGNTVNGLIADTNDPSYFKPGPIRLVLEDHGVARLLRAGTEVGTTLCGPKFADAPEEVRAMTPCGA